ncbi:uncharacterized protein [Physcomitrium patens]|uniref:Uncharacterized protein n=1 Tax=Physcomitrium patens TaxID=3218 RepID=A0A2K1J9K8_PHYPA|nr:uncharacterized protein LOC112293798 [Physcomitrium patens]PNR38199.1 hypothetical protein PHYPA_021310 [Physcomitrium patens]|eukprot:XP_024399412.1 uncharacterized protein LOC112293798 [Physcomitrella patens]
MAKSLLFVALLVTLAVAAQANSLPAPPPATTPVTSPAPAPAPHHHYHHDHDFSLKLILHNVAKRAVTFKLVKPLISRAVVVPPHKWSSIAPFTPKYPSIEVVVIVENKTYKTVTKNLKINLLQHFGHKELKGDKFLVLTAVESWSWKSKYLLVTIGEVVILSIKL